MPLAVGKDTSSFPGFDGGVEWGGAAFDPDTGLSSSTRTRCRIRGLVENTEAPDADGRELYRAHCAACHGDDLQGTPPQCRRSSASAREAA